MAFVLYELKTGVCFFRWSGEFAGSQWTLHSHAPLPPVSLALSRGKEHNFVWRESGILSIVVTIYTPGCAVHGANYYYHRSSPIFPIMWYICTLLQGLSGFLFQTVRVAGAVCVPCQVHASILQSYGHLPQFHVSPRNNFEVSDKNFCVTILKFLQALATVHGCSFRQKDSSVGSECTPTR